MAALDLPELPDELAALRGFARDLRWTWNHEADALWSRVGGDLWERTRNPWVVLHNAPPEHMRAVAADATFLAELAELSASREQSLKTPGWFRSDGRSLGGVAYFSMEFGLGAAMPLYAGGLGVLAGDFLKTASDLDVPLIGVGLLYQEGYFRQMLEASGAQEEFYPYNEPAAMPIEPVILSEGGWLRVTLDLPGRIVRLRVWRATVGRVSLYLLDSNDPLNSPADRGITTKLYGGGAETRFLQDLALGVGGWRVVAALHPEIDVLHVNEGHGALAILERARQHSVRTGIEFWEALWATRAGNVFTTHTPVPTGFDIFGAGLLRKYIPHLEGVLARSGVRMNDVLALGRVRGEADEPFNMAYFALRGSALTFAVSRLHGQFSRRIFQPLFPRTPTCEVPVSHITNGVHVPTWDSAAADRIWTEACGKERWRAPASTDFEAIARIPDEALWSVRGAGREHLVRTARARLTLQLSNGGFTEDVVAGADTVLDANILTLGFARRFTEYKRTNLLLRDLARFSRLVLDERRPVQIIVAGKAHPDDAIGKAMIREWVEVARSPTLRGRVAFLEDYDLDLAQHLVQGVDVWINTPRRPWEACGTSGMKVLVNGGLNCSCLDGWWDEAYEPSLGWAIGGDAAGSVEEIDARDAKSLYEVLERHVVPEFYERDASGLPRAWLERIRRSMRALTPAFASTRMMKDYVEKAYLPLASAVRTRAADGSAKAKNLNAWSRALHRRWTTLHIGDPMFGEAGAEPGGDRAVTVPVFMGEVEAGAVRVELYADPRDAAAPEVIPLARLQPIPGATNGYIFAGRLPAARPPEDYAVRALPRHPDAFLPTELPLIAWQR
jgi:starch phosphorylase